MRQIVCEFFLEFFFFHLFYFFSLVNEMQFEWFSAFQERVYATHDWKFSIFGFFAILFVELAFEQQNNCKMGSHI